MEFFLEYIDFKSTGKNFDFKKYSFRMAGITIKMHFKTIWTIRKDDPFRNQAYKAPCFQIPVSIRY